MIQKKIDRLLLKFLEDRISEAESTALKNWLKDADNKIYFEDFIEVNYFLQKKKPFPSKESLDKAMGKILPVKRFYIRKYVKYAAMLVLFLGVSYFYKQGYFSTNPVFVIPTESITLELENGALEIITVNGATKIVDVDGTIIGAQEGDQIVYSNAVEKEKLSYNTLRVPNGKRFQLLLSDGTQVHLNSGTTLRYPVQFIKSKPRQVFLDGEALFEVSKSKTHPFIVDAGELNVRVLGTRFNVNSYSEDTLIKTVLIEGSVGLYDSTKLFDISTATLLKPGKIASFSKTTKEINVSKVDTKEYTAWVEGKLYFKRRPFSEIIKVLERHYDVTITNTYQKLESQKFFAKFETETIEEVLTSFQFSEAFNFEIDGKEIRITKPIH